MFILDDTANGSRHNAARSEAYQLGIVEKSKSQTSPIVLFVQLLPLILLKPLRVALHWFSFVVFLILFRHYWTVVAQWKELLSFIFAVLSARLSVNLIVYPLICLLVKWLVIGKYRHGNYPLWGQYYLRWWFVDQTIRIFGFGVFEWDDRLRIIFLRLMGTKIGKHVTIDPKTEIREFDLIKIKSNVKIHRCVISPFTLITSYMVLAPIQIGNNCYIGLNTRVAPGATIRDGAQLGPLSSSYEMNSATTVERGSLPSSETNLNFVFKLFAWPVILVVTILAYTPWIGSIYLLIDTIFSSANTNDLLSVIFFFADGRRVAFHLLSVVARDIIKPFFYMAGCLLVKRIIIGKFTETKQEEQEEERTHKTNIRRQIHLLKHWLMKELLPGGDLKGLGHLIGIHYEIISIIYRLLGARIGKRIYWPGSGLGTYEYDLLTIEDDVIFGSRSYFQCSSNAKKYSKRITIKSGAMIADRCVLLPGVTVEKNTVLGSGSLAKENTTYPAGSTWIGSKEGNAVLWSQGEENMSAVETETLTPFGRAFYKREKTSFWVMPLWLHVIYSLSVNIFRSILWSMPVVASIQLIALIFRHVSKSSTLTIVETGVYTFFLLLGFLSFFQTATSLLSLAIEILFKWLLFGRRQPGEYNWDQSSYCQRWQLHIVLQRLRRNVLSLFCGSAYLCFYYRCLGCRIGRNVCLYPNGADPMMTEPDLVTIGDHCCIDDASIICHLNTKGQFSLNPLVIGNRCVLRSQSRLMSGASMEDDSTLLEHTLIPSGDTADEGTIWQGWPSTDVTEKFRGKRVSSQIEARRSSQRRDTASQHPISKNNSSAVLIPLEPDENV